MLDLAIGSNKELSKLICYEIIESKYIRSPRGITFLGWAKIC